MFPDAALSLLALVVLVAVIWRLSREDPSSSAPESSLPRARKSVLSLRKFLFAIAGMFVVIYIVLTLYLHRKISENKVAYAELFAQGGGAHRLLHSDAETRYWREGGTYDQFRNVTVLPNGALEFRVDFPFAGRFYLIPRPGGNSGYLQWNCVTADSPWLRSLWLDCAHIPDFKPDLPILVDRDNVHVLYFDSNKMNEQGMSEEGREQFGKFISSLTGPWIRQVLRVEITAYSDPVGTVKNNLVVANARAAYAREAFVARGISRDSISERVIGSEFQEARNCAKEPKGNPRDLCFTKNRRVEIRVSYRMEV